VGSNFPVQPTSIPQTIAGRTISISRIGDLPTGDAGYRSGDRGSETVVLTGLACDIQFVTRGPDPAPKVPEDTVGRQLWRIFVLANAVAVNAIKRNDVATDDLGRRFKLNDMYWGAIDLVIEAELERG